MHVYVRDVTAAEAYPLRRRVLRPGFEESVIVFEGDAVPGAFHLGAFEAEAGGEPVGIATFFPSPRGSVADAWQLRGMAVAPEVQGRGVGAALLAAGVARVGALGAPLLWANGRDSALGFYERHGWKVVGDGFTYGPADLPHHIVELPLWSR
jgi:GNAT superfamily N-acetyltransferase